VKYFFLTEGWTYKRVWEFGGLWRENLWGRPPQIQRLKLGMIEAAEVLWLYQVEEAVLMIEVQPQLDSSTGAIGQVILKRLITAEQVIEQLCRAEKILN
jgi:hypothetical protein